MFNKGDLLLLVDDSNADRSAISIGEFYIFDQYDFDKRTAYVINFKTRYYDGMWSHRFIKFGDANNEFIKFLANE